jgi:hypothetical protein
MFRTTRNRPDFLPGARTDSSSDGQTCAQRNGLIVPLGQAQTHIEAKHSIGTLAVTSVQAQPLGAE